MQSFIVRLTRFPLICLAAVSTAAAAALPPQIGDTAPNFSLRALDARPVELHQLTAQRRVVLVVLRGWVGYQCPVCTRQVNEFTGKAAEFARRNVDVVMVYPGPAEPLKARAGEFLKNKEWPPEFFFALDPDYAFTNGYGLRWDAKNETAYPSTFVVERDGRVSFARISKTHGGRVSARAVLDALDAAK